MRKPVYPPGVEHTGRNVVTIRYPAVAKGFEAWVLLRSDVHHDNPHSDRRMEKRHLELAKERNAWVIDNGDLFCAMQGKYDKRASKDTVRPEHQRSDYLDALVGTAAEFYRPYANHFAVLGRGNHETAIRGRHETDLTDRLAERLRAYGSPVVASGYGGWVVFRFMSNGWQKTIRLHHFHGSGGGGPVTRGVITTNRMAVYTPDAEIVLTGHTHDEWTVPIRRQRISAAGVPYQDEQLHVRVPGYKDEFGAGEGGWWVETGKAPRPRGAAWLRFWLEFPASRNGRDIRYEILRAQ
jgi:hypothetical protein